MSVKIVTTSVVQLFFSLSRSYSLFTWPSWYLLFSVLSSSGFWSPLNNNSSISFAFKRTISCTFVSTITAFNHPAAPNLCICSELSGEICLHPAVVKALSSYFSSLDLNSYSNNYYSYYLPHPYRLHGQNWLGDTSHMHNLRHTQVMVMKK